LNTRPPKSRRGCGPACFGPASLIGRAADPRDDQEAHNYGHDTEDAVHAGGDLEASVQLEGRAILTGAPTISTSLTAARQRITTHDGSNSNRRMLNFGARGCA
jgi:hypothetical protein